MAGGRVVVGWTLGMVCLVVFRNSQVKVAVVRTTLYVHALPYVYGIGGGIGLGEDTYPGALPPTEFGSPVNQAGDLI